MSSVYTVAFWRDTGERVLSTFLQGLLGIWVLSDVVPDGSVPHVNPSAVDVFAGAGIIAAIALIKCLIAGLASPATGASLGTAIPAQPRSATPAPGPKHAAQGE